MESWGTFIVLRFVHVVAGVLWVGAIAFVAVLLLPAVRAAGPAGGAVMRQITQRRMTLLMQTVASLTLISGGLLYWRISGGFQTAWLTSGPGLTFGIGGLIGLAGAIIGFVVSAPTAKRLVALGTAVTQSGGQPTPDQASEMSRLQGRLLGASQLVALLVVVSAATMAVARYV